MLHINVAILDPAKKLSGELGKKGSETDFTIYNFKKGDSVLSLYEPTLYPEKLQPLLYCLNLCDMAILVVRSIDKFLGEQIIALDLLGIPGYLILDGVSQEELAPLIKGTHLEKYQTLEYEPIALREKLLTTQFTRADSPLKILIDRCFAVKSVGTVALGVIKKGVVKVHDELSVFPGGKNVSVKSLQVQDEDVKQADSGSRVGLCFKGAEVDDIPKGCFLSSSNGLTSATKFKCHVSISKFFKGGIAEGAKFMACIGLQFVPATVHTSTPIPAGGKGEIEIELEKPAGFEAGEKLLLARPEAGLRVAGVASVKH
ncbi:Elongation factor 1-alpha [Candidatus Gugararchaeum adminiculabundum]|nr:Elongation factor 1-alpha [Candidatus Gugararchaeum adminiculabundum]